MWQSIALFALGGLLIAYAGPKLVSRASQLGDITGLGQSLAGVLFLGASTSLPGLIVSFNTAMSGNANVAVSNSIGGIAAQTAFIGIADIAYRKGKLTHRNTLSASLLQSAILISLLSLILLAMLAPTLSILNVHPITPLLILFIVAGFNFIKQSKESPQWKPVKLPEDEQVSPDSGKKNMRKPPEITNQRRERLSYTT